MWQIGGAIVGMTLVLTAVFVPMAFFGGAVGGIYRQFAVSMVASMLRVGVHGAVVDARAVREPAEADRPATTTQKPASSAGSTACSRAPRAVITATVAKILQQTACAGSC